MGGQRIPRPIRIAVLSLACLSALLVSGCRGSSGSSNLIAETYIYKTTEVCALQADVYRPAQGESLPAILWIHPGGLITGSRSWIAAEQVQLYLDAGYLVVSIDHHLAPESKLPNILEDVLDAHTWIREDGPALFGADPERIAIVGHSAGGYLALLAGTRLDPGPRALVSFYGYGTISDPWVTQPGVAYQDRPILLREDVSGAVGEAPDGCTPKKPSMDPRFDFYIYARQHGVWPVEVSGHDPMSEPEWFTAYEPAHSLTSAFPPTLLLHGEQDRDVPFMQADLMVQALQTAGVEHRRVTDPDWGHVFDAAGLEDSSVEAAFNQVIAFLDSHLK